MTWIINWANIRVCDTLYVKYLWSYTVKRIAALFRGCYLCSSEMLGFVTPEKPQSITHCTINYAAFTLLRNFMIFKLVLHCCAYFMSWWLCLPTRDPSCDTCETNINPYNAKLSKLYFYLLEVVGRGSDPQFQVGKNTHTCVIWDQTFTNLDV